MWSEQPPRDVFSLHAELRFLAWGGVTLIAAGAGVIVTRHLDDIGPLAIGAAIFLASAACYAYAWWKRSRAASLLDDYVLLLGALLLSAGVGLAEHQWHFLGANWQRHFLLLALAHGVAAYLYDSRLVLSLSVAALAAWMGVEQRGLLVSADNFDKALRMLAAAAAAGVWRALNRRAGFNPVFEHFAAHLAFLGALILVFEEPPIGLMLVLAFAAFAVWIGFRRRAEAYVVYAWIYGTIAVIAFAVLRTDNGVTAMILTLFFSIAAIAGLMVTHANFARKKA